MSKPGVKLEGTTYFAWDGGRRFGRFIKAHLAVSPKLWGTRNLWILYYVGKFYIAGVLTIVALYVMGYHLAPASAFYSGFATGGIIGFLCAALIIDIAWRSKTHDPLCPDCSNQPTFGNLPNPESYRSSEEAGK